MNAQDVEMTKLRSELAICRLAEAIVALSAPQTSETVERARIHMFEAVNLVHGMREVQKPIIKA